MINLKGLCLAIAGFIVAGIDAAALYDLTFPLIRKPEWMMVLIRDTVVRKRISVKGRSPSTMAASRCEVSI